MALPLEQLRIRASFHAHEAGGRKRPPTQLDSGSYRPHLKIDDSQLMGIQFLAGPESAVADVPFEASVKCVYPAEDYSALVVGAQFKIFEVSREVGRGVVLAVLPTQAP